MENAKFSISTPKLSLAAPIKSPAMPELGVYKILASRSSSEHTLKPATTRHLAPSVHLAKMDNANKSSSRPTFTAVESLPKAAPPVNSVSLDHANIFPSPKRSIKQMPVVNPRHLVILASFAGRASACLSVSLQILLTAAATKRGVELMSFASLESASRTFSARLKLLLHVAAALLAPAAVKRVLLGFLCLVVPRPAKG